MKHAPEKIFPGEAGFVLLVYVGKASKSRVWTGGYTGTRYLFGGKKRKGRVDVRDSIGFLFPDSAGGAPPVFVPGAPFPEKGASL